MSNNTLRLLSNPEENNTPNFQALLEEWNLEHSYFLKILLDSYCIVDLNNNLVSWNYAYEDLIEQSYKKIQKNPVFNHYFQTEIGPAKWEKCFNEGKICFREDQFSATIKTPTEDKIKRLILAAVPIHSNQGDRLGTLVTIRNVTDEHNIQTERIESIYKSNIDGLTQLYNKMFTQEWLKRQLEVAQRHKFAVSVMLGDVDHFKQVNDKYGHQVGDHVLKTVAAIIQQETRESDVAGRFGGEEFMVVMTNTKQDGALVAAERIRERIANTHVEHDGKPVPLSISIGTATFLALDPSNFSSDRVSFEIVAKSDKALYSAKASGRNRTCQFETLSQTKETDSEGK
jgi:diguanylate cyclase (GGDEF)-like protein